MPTFYFDIVQGDLVEEDHTGSEALDEHAARQIAATSIIDLLKKEKKKMTGAVIEIRDDNRHLVATVPVDLAADAASGSVH